MTPAIPLTFRSDYFIAVVAGPRLVFTMLLEFMQEAPANYECSTAEEITYLTPGYALVEGYTYYGSVDINPLHSYFQLPLQSDMVDVWYTFNSQTNFYLTISFCDNGGILRNLAGTVSVFAKTSDCNSFPAEGCMQRMPISCAPIQTVLSTNRDYFIVVTSDSPSSVSDFSFSFQLLSQGPAENDLCENAAPLNPNMMVGGVELVPGTSKGATFDVIDEPLLCTPPSTSSNVWYTFNSYEFNRLSISACYQGSTARPSLTFKLLPGNCSAFTACMQSSAATCSVAAMPEASLHTLELDIPRNTRSEER